MTQDGDHAPRTPPEDREPEPRRTLSPEAKRALEEAEARRASARRDEARQTELGGPKGPEPTRYGDWEKKGITHDF